jgi:hypothetical protein
MDYRTDITTLIACRNHNQQRQEESTRTTPSKRTSVAGPMKRAYRKAIVRSKQSQIRFLQQQIDIGSAKMLIRGASEKTLSRYLDSRTEKLRKLEQEIIQMKSRRWTARGHNNYDRCAD